MPHPRTTKKATALAVGTLFAFGFIPVTKEEAQASLGRSCIKPPEPSPVPDPVHRLVVPKPEATPAAQEAVVDAIDLQDEWFVLRIGDWL